MLYQQKTASLLAGLFLVHGPFRLLRLCGMWFEQHEIAVFNSV